VLAGLRGDRLTREVCREHEISETLYYSWRSVLAQPRCMNASWIVGSRS